MRRGEDLAVDDVRLLPQQVRVERPHVGEPVVLGTHGQIDHPPRGRVVLQDDAELHQMRFCDSARPTNRPWALVPCNAPLFTIIVPREKTVSTWPSIS